MLENDQWREGSEMVYFGSSGRGSLYRLDEELGVTDMAMVERWFPGSFVHG